MKRVCVYCGSSTGNQSVYREAAEAMGSTEGFIKPIHRASIVVDDNPGRLLDTLARFDLPYVPK